MSEKKPNKANKIISYSINTIFYLIIAFLLVFSIANIQVKRDDDIPHIFGFGFMTVLTGSMATEEADSIDVGDLIFVRILSERQKENLEVGDVITFFSPTERRIITHRINAKIPVGDIVYFETKGDANNQPDEILLGFDDILAIHRSTWSGAGEVLLYAQSPVGFALIVILPVFLILIYQGINLGRNVFQLNQAKLKEKHEAEKALAKEELEKEKERMKQELLAELQKENKQKQ